MMMIMAWPDLIDAHRPLSARFVLFIMTTFD